MNIHEIYIKRCIELSKNAQGHTYPNPAVGCVIVYKDRIIGEGYTSKPGLAHAEVNAIGSVSDQHVLKESTLYVSLEPCAHTGRTPPCTDLILEKGIPRVVIGTTDLNEKVRGKGIQKLRDHGVEVITGVCEDLCKIALARFNTFHGKKRPYVILKWAESADGFIAPPPSLKIPQQPVWLSNPLSRQLVHKWRTEEQAILVGSGTANTDNPALTPRDWQGTSPLRVVWQKGTSLSDELQMFKDGNHTVLFSNMPPSEVSRKYGPYVTPAYYGSDQPLIPGILKYLYEMDIQSLIVEGGAHTLISFIKEELWDEARIFRTPAVLGKGVAAPTLNGRLMEQQLIHSDLLQFIHRSTR